MSIEFKAWPKIARLYRDMIITEKIDGTNAAVGIVPADWSKLDSGETEDMNWCSEEYIDGVHYQVYAQSRTRIITPFQDNFGFARWVMDNAPELVRTLGLGLHYGEWWGSGIQRGYGLLRGEKRFSLFNVNRYENLEFSEVPGLALVPILYQGPFSDHKIQHELAKLEVGGSQAAPGFMDPEGVVIWHSALNGCFKVTIKNDQAPKGKTCVVSQEPVR
jgi:hypothetical protein